MDEPGVRTPEPMRRAVAALRAVLALCLGLGAPLAAACDEEPATRDGALAGQVRRALEADPDVAADDVDVAVRGDDVVLTGEVDTLLEKWAAVEAAAGVIGPEAVVDRLVVNTPRVADRALQRRVNQALTVDPSTALDVRVEVARGVACVRGAVASPEEQVHVSEIVASVPGVTAVENLARIEPAAAK